MKVLHVRRNLDKVYSGAVRGTYDFAKSCQGLGFDNYTASRNLDKKYSAEKHITAKVFKDSLWGSNISKRLKFAKNVEKYQHKNNFDLTVGHGDNFDQDILYLHNTVHLEYELIHGKPIPEDHEMNIVHSKILQEQRFSKVIANSHLMKNDLVSRFNIPEESIHVLYPCMDESVFFPQKEEQKQKTRAHYKIEQNDIVIGLVTSGNFKKRGIDRLATILSALPKELLKKVKILVVGKGKIPDIDKFADLAEHVIELPIIKEIQDIYNIIDVFLYPARVEEFGRVVNEAMGCGCPVITGDMVGAAELFTGRSRDFICHSVEEFAPKLEQLLADAELRQELAELNAKDALVTTHEHFDRGFRALLQEMGKLS